MAKTKGHRDYFASDIEWAPGSEDGVTYARFLMDEDDWQSPLMIMSKFEPGVVVGAHTHDANYMEYIIEGEQTVGKVKYGKGDVRVVKGGTGYGPITIGPDGCKVLIVFQSATGAMMRPLGRV